MKPNELISRIYYGDSGCKKLIIDCWGRCVMIQLDSIFLMKGESFDYLVDEEIIDGFIVFEGVSGFNWSGVFLPNDSVNSIYCDSINGKGEYEFTLSINHVDSQAHSHEIVLLISASEFSLKRSYELIKI